MYRSDRVGAGTAGRGEDSQVGVFLALAGSRASGSRALIDRALYLPKSWCEDRKRLDGAGVPPGVEFKAKPQLARHMISRALGTDLYPKWVFGDAVYGSDCQTRHFLESRG